MCAGFWKIDSSTVGEDMQVFFNKLPINTIVFLSPICIAPELEVNYRLSWKKIHVYDGYEELGQMPSKCHVTLKIDFLQGIFMIAVISAC